MTIMEIEYKMIKDGVYDGHNVTIVKRIDKINEAIKSLKEDYNESEGWNLIEVKRIIREI